MSIKNVSSSLENINTFQSNSYKKEFNNFGRRLEELGSTLSANSENNINFEGNRLLGSALHYTGNIYNKLGDYYSDKSKESTQFLLDRFNLYRKLLNKIPSSLQFERLAGQVYDDLQLKTEKLDGRGLDEVFGRKQIISHVTFAEINHFNKSKVTDLTCYMRVFLQSQIKFYTEIVERLKETLEKFPLEN